MSNIIWIIVIGFIAGIIARFLSPGGNEPRGFILTTVLGIAGAFLATFIGQTVGWYRLDQGAGLIGATVGALLVLVHLEPAGGKQRHSRSRRYDAQMRPVLAAGSSRSSSIASLPTAGPCHFAVARLTRIELGGSHGFA